MDLNRIIYDVEKLRKRIYERRREYWSKYITDTSFTNTDDDNWKTLKNGTHVNVGRGGVIIGGPRALRGKKYKSLRDKKKQKDISQVSPYGKNKPCKGFANEDRAKEHKKHYSELGVKSNQEYIDLANSLLTQAVGGKIDGYQRKDDGAIIRFDTEECIIAIGYPGAELLTCFRPKYKKKKQDKTLAREYFYREKKEGESYEDGKE